MATKKERKPRSDKKPELRSVMVRLRADQDEALTREALRRATEANESRPDRSAIVREALDAHPRMKR